MRVLRIITAGTLLAALCACGGAGGGGGIFGPGGGNGGIGVCDPGTSVQLARPAPGSYTSNVSSIEIVASGNNNTLYNTYGNWNVSVVNNYTGQTFTGNQLNLASDPNGPHPFSSDFYYSSQLNTTLPGGNSWNVYLNENNYGGYGGYCNAYQVGSFST